jgi:hypothetical protein
MEHNNSWNFKINLLKVIGKFSIVALGEENNFELKPKEPNIKLQTSCLFMDELPNFSNIKRSQLIRHIWMKVSKVSLSIGIRKHVCT